MRINFPGGMNRGRTPRRGMGGNPKLRLLIALAVALFVLGSYFLKSSVNPVTGEKQRVGMSQEQEVALGLATAPQMALEFGGPSRNTEAQAVVQTVGQKLLAAVHKVYGVAQMPYQFSFTLLDDDQTVNAFALPGGPTFITEALFSRLENEDHSRA